MSVPEPVSCFFVQAVAEPGTLPRLLELFSKRGITPGRVHSSVSGQRLHVDLEATALGDHQTACVAQAMRQIPTVELVLTSAKELSAVA